MDVSSSSAALAEQPSWCDGKRRTSRFNQNYLVDLKFSGWLYLTNYSKFCFVLHKNINKSELFSQWFGSKMQLSNSVLDKLWL